MAPLVGEEGLDEGGCLEASGAVRGSSGSRRLRSPSGTSSPAFALEPVEAAGRRCYLLGMADVPFDTLAVTRQLKARGFDADQAEAITDAVRTGVTGGVATKADISELRAGVAEVRTELRWVKVIGTGIIGLLIAAFGFVINMLIEMSASLAALEAALSTLASGG